MAETGSWDINTLTPGQKVEATQFLGGGSVEEEFEEATVVGFDEHKETGTRRVILKFANGKTVPIVEGSPSVRVPNK
jgi:hypothetical protein